MTGDCTSTDHILFAEYVFDEEKLFILYTHIYIDMFKNVLRIFLVDEVTKNFHLFTRRP